MAAKNQNDEGSNDLMEEGAIKSLEADLMK